MEINEFIEKKGQLETKLTQVISDAVADFEEETGLTLSFIMPILEQVTTIGERFNRYKITNVVTEFDFL